MSKLEDRSIETNQSSLKKMQKNEQSLRPTGYQQKCKHNYKGNARIRGETKITFEQK